MAIQKNQFRLTKDLLRLLDNSEISIKFRTVLSHGVTENFDKAGIYFRQLKQRNDVLTNDIHAETKIAYELRGDNNKLKPNALPYIGVSALNCQNCYDYLQTSFSFAITRGTSGVRFDDYKFIEKDERVPVPQVVQIAAQTSSGRPQGADQYDLQPSDSEIDEDDDNNKLLRTLETPPTIKTSPLIRLRS